ncbi:hypothetical protein [Ornithinibacillus sp. 179-J 7C1 HS]|uniref:hypothetical protein n=1 Tax=Ornithinibacillus sp. 179-J 7C1 HS TaxID=3142384 RepID=UPI00399F334D
MKKLFASLALGTLLMGGFLFMQNSQAADLTQHGEVEPSIFKMSSVSIANLY